MADPITIEEVAKSLAEHFQGCEQEQSTGIVSKSIKIEVWEFHLGVSVSTSASHTAVLGEATLSFIQASEDRARKPVLRRRLITTSLEEMEEFISWCDEWIGGVFHAISMAYEPLPDPEPELVPGILGLLGRGSE